MTRRLVVLLALAGLIALALIAGPPHAGVRASVSHQAAATATATSTVAVTDTATATATVGAAAATATATATVSAATAVATTTATATATSVPLAAYPAPLMDFSVSRAGATLVYRWSVLTRKGVKGFNIYAGSHKLNAQLIKTHVSNTYKKTVSYRAGHPALRVILRNGRYFTVRD